jgi:adenylyltransferase/sulfurtransferase
MLLPGFGADGQERLGAATVVVIGCGALGCAAADLLCRAGVGTLVIVDRDVVEWTNLQRQTLFDEGDARAGAPKAEAAARRLGAVNSGVRTVPVIADVTARNVEALVEGRGAVGGVACAWGRAACVVDATDNFQTRYLVNDACVKHGVALAYGGVVGTVGTTMTVLPGETACLRCVFPEPPPAGRAPTCDTAGVLGPMVSAVASVQAAEAMKVVLGRRGLVRPVVTQIDLWSGVHRELSTAGIDRAACPCCGARRFEFLEGERAEGGAGTLCGTDAVQIGGGEAVDLEALADRLAGVGSVRRTASMVRAGVGGGVELTVFRDGRAIVRGVRGVEEARGVYARYVGA